MKFKELQAFLDSKMRLGHIYQPVLIEYLVESGGSATLRQIATAFLLKDESQVIYYEKRLKDQPIKVLSKHGIITKTGDLLNLNVEKLTFAQKADIKRKCEEKIQEYMKLRGLSIWDYRMLDIEEIPDSLRYRVLKEAGGRCALCGVTRDDRPLDVDHIIPRSRGGMTVYENLQVLCSRCNRSKRDVDETDFRHAVEKRLPNCPFCESNLHQEKMVENDYAYAVFARVPVSKGHTLLIPRRHFSDFFRMTRAEWDGVFDLLRITQKQLVQSDASIGGFNIKVDSGEVAGQRVPHCHIDLMPRRPGDTDS